MFVQGQEDDSSYVDKLFKVRVKDCLKDLFVTCICKQKQEEGDKMMQSSLPRN